METLLHDENPSFKEGLAIALGNFDGVHMGHRKLFNKVLEEGREHGVRTLVYTFETHPKLLLAPEKPFHVIMDNYQKMKVIESLGLDFLYFADFNKVKELSAEDFVRKVLKEKFNIKSVTIGWNYRFGKNGEGTPEKLMQLGVELGFHVIVVPAVQVDGHTVSSTLIRHHIRSGDMELSKKLLGDSYFLRSSVIHGKRNGGKMGIHTANIEINRQMTLPAKGVYATNSYYLGKKYRSVTNVGTNPTFDGDSVTIETHIFEFQGDLYGEFLEVEFLKKMRDEKKFQDIQELVVQIQMDIRDRENME